MVRDVWWAAWSPAWLKVAGRDGMSGCGGDAGLGDVAGGEPVEGVQRRGEFWRCVGPVWCHQRAQDVVVDLGVDVGEQQPVAGQSGNPLEAWTLTVSGFV